MMICRRWEVLRRTQSLHREPNCYEELTYYSDLQVVTRSTENLPKTTSAVVWSCFEIERTIFFSTTAFLGGILRFT